MFALFALLAACQGLEAIDESTTVVTGYDAGATTTTSTTPTTTSTTGVPTAGISAVPANDQIVCFGIGTANMTGTMWGTGGRMTCPVGSCSAVVRDAAGTTNINAVGCSCDLGENSSIGPCHVLCGPNGNDCNFDRWGYGCSWSTCPK